jgi:maleylacetate reductase
MSPIEAASGSCSPPGAVLLAARCGRGGVTDSCGMRFSHQTLPQTVHFGSGEAQPNIAFALEELGAGRVMLIASARSRDEAHRITAGLPIVAFHDEVVRHVPLDVAERARAVAAEHEVDAVVSVGGGSATGLAKAIALTSEVPIVAVPTTYAGSEATSMWGMTDAGRKTTGIDWRVLPRTIVYDPVLTLDLPVETSVASALNALAHCVDSLWAPKADPINRALALDAVRALNTGLPELVAAPRALDGRDQVLYAAYLAGVAFASAGSGLHHKICHVLGGRYDLPHAETHAIVLPYVLAFNGPAVPKEERLLASAFGADTAAEGLERLRASVSAPRALRDYGLAEDDLAEAADAVLAAVPAVNPRAVSAEAIVTLLRAAWEGADPATMRFAGEVN